MIRGGAASKELILVVFICLAAAVTGYYLPTFICWLREKMEISLVRIRMYTLQLKYIFRRSEKL